MQPHTSSNKSFPIQRADVVVKNEKEKRSLS
jgi:hypothetical protein